MTEIKMTKEIIREIIEQSKDPKLMTWRLLDFAQATVNTVRNELAPPVSSETSDQ